MGHRENRVGRPPNQAAIEPSPLLQPRPAGRLDLFAGDALARRSNQQDLKDVGVIARLGSFRRAQIGHILVQPGVQQGGDARRIGLIPETACEDALLEPVADQLLSTHWASLLRNHH